MRDIAEIAENVLLYALRDMRRDANKRRLVGLDGSPYRVGLADGHLLVAEYDLRADPVLVQAVRNEVRFLAYEYGRRAE